MTIALVFFRVINDVIKYSLVADPRLTAGLFLT